MKALKKVFKISSYTSNATVPSDFNCNDCDKVLPINLPDHHASFDTYDFNPSEQQIKLCTSELLPKDVTVRKNDDVSSKSSNKFSVELEIRGTCSSVNLLRNKYDANTSPRISAGVFYHNNLGWENNSSADKNSRNSCPLIVLTSGDACSSVASTSTCLSSETRISDEILLPGKDCASDMIEPSPNSCLITVPPSYLRQSSESIVKNIHHSGNLDNFLRPCKSHQKSTYKSVDWGLENSSKDRNRDSLTNYLSFPRRKISFAKSTEHDVHGCELMQFTKTLQESGQM